MSIFRMLQSPQQVAQLSKIYPLELSTRSIPCRLFGGGRLQYAHGFSVILSKSSGTALELSEVRKGHKTFYGDATVGTQPVKLWLVVEPNVYTFRVYPVQPPGTWRDVDSVGMVMTRVVPDHHRPDMRRTAAMRRKGRLRGLFTPSLEAQGYRVLLSS